MSLSRLLNDPTASEPAATGGFPAPAMADFSSAEAASTSRSKKKRPSRAAAAFAMEEDLDGNARRVSWHSSRLVIN